ncbi:aspartyl-phosphate phosphatase Spo0E family protein [Metabacillus sediminilitoris]|uniref:Aspartyl-phosphate phosphatase Spo0E family protein n=1 Tax=Metabacillus sediminilitoris TaxID=2567941 RepID=A0A4S4C3Q1_9BACI|nr:aspartyl-phosphate phosphatase Spo0E family protein [Metabacillus sediminilitoris]QGQ45397.1 Spo0E family sporulation regulatory protein-aspartic acid phosphatase [Metabacillus sediminilitoris]THF82305.1 aspartyl-phosphate phosphatase Spo0E family protein [Metabacillus sediminilitoris]
MCTEVDELECRINQMRKILIWVAEETGLNSHSTLYYSQKLDVLITRYQNVKMKNPKKYMQDSYIDTK